MGVFGGGVGGLRGGGGTSALKYPDTQKNLILKDLFP